MYDCAAPLRMRARYVVLGCNGIFVFKRVLDNLPGRFSRKSTGKLKHSSKSSVCREIRATCALVDT